jgi:hypothetical protein
MTLARLIYTSRATTQLSRDTLTAIITKARDKNRKLDITGVLLYGGGRFLQVLEGDVFVIASLYDKIKDDHRHADCSQLGLAPTRKRLFRDWRMALVNLDHAAGMERRPLQILAKLTEALDGVDLDRVMASLLREFVVQCGGMPGGTLKPTPAAKPAEAGAKAA